NRMPPCCCFPDHEETCKEVKHIFAVRYVIERDQDAEGNVTVTETLTVAKRKTYPRDWDRYDMAATTEKDRFQELLFDLCQGVPQPERKLGRGRPPVPIADQVFSACFQVYSTLSTRRSMCDLRQACDRGFLSRAVP